MRIVFINQFFWPDAAATSQLLTDLTRALAAEGHDVHVICGKGTYAPANDLEDAPPVTIHRLRGLAFSRGKIALPLSYLSFLMGALWRGLWIRNTDVVVTMTTPPMLSVVGTLLKKVRCVRHFIWAMDLFPEALVDVGLLKDESIITRLLRWVADQAYLRADGVIALGECMRRRLLEREVPESKLHVAENWADGSRIFPMGHRKNGTMVLLYSGNLGRSHDSETLLFAMERLKDDERFQFRFVGSGIMQTRLQEMCRKKGLQNVSFLPYCSRTRLAESLSEADIGLVTQRSTSLGSVVPSKVYGLLAAGRPILYIGPRATTPFEIVERFQCGWNIGCGEGEDLVALLQNLYVMRHLVLSAGTRARDAFLAHYDMPQALARICSLLGAPAERAEVMPVNLKAIS